MSVTFTVAGLDALKAALRALPAELAEEGGAIVRESAAIAEHTIRSEYEAHRWTGNLADHLRSEPMSGGRFGAAVQLRSTARHAHLFESGTEARHYITVRGVKKAVGKMPPSWIFIRTMSRERKRMYGRLAELLERAGLAPDGFEGLVDG